MPNLVAALDRKLYPRFQDNWDDAMLRDRILARLKPEMTILDVGAGSGLVSQMSFQGAMAKVCGIDPEESVRQNPFLNEAKVGVAEAIPYPDCSFDLAFSDNVWEHLPKPAEALAEVFRVLKPGGWYLAKTPNRRHPIPTVARLTSLAFHRRYNRLRGRKEEDTFPTVYRLNSAATVRRLSAGAGFTNIRITLVEGRPEYLRISAATYLCGWLYERAVNLIPGLSPFRLVLYAELQKPNAKEAT